MNNIIKDPAKRAWIYGISVALGAALVVFGFASDEQVQAVLNIVAAVLLIGSNGLALANTPKREAE